MTNILLSKKINASIFMAILCIAAISQENNADIEEVVTVSSKIEVPAKDVVGSVSLITQSDLETRVVNDLQEVFENTIGVTVPRSIRSGRTRNDGVTIRGIGDKRVNILIDGVRVGDAYQSGGFGKDVVDPILLKRVEVLKGPSSALYGSDGLAGTVSYTTKDPSDLASSGNPFVSVAMGSATVNQLSKISALTAFVKGNMEALVQVTTREVNELEIHNDSTSPLNPMEGDGLSLLAKLKLNMANGSDLTLTIDNQETDAKYELLNEIGTSYFPQAEEVTESIGDDNSTRERVTLSYNFESGNALFDSGEVRLFSQTTDQKQVTDKTKALIAFGPFGPSFIPTLEHKDYGFNQDLEGFAVDLYKQLKIGSTTHDLVYGFESEEASYSRPKDRYETNLTTGEINRVFFGPEIFPNKAFPDSEVVRDAFYLSDRVSLSESTTFVFGLRHDNYEQKAIEDSLSAAGNPANHPLLPREDSETSLKLGVIQDLNDTVSVFAQVAEGYRNPDFTDAYNTYTNYAFGYTIIPNPDLKAEYSTGYELGLRGTKEEVKWSLVLYKNNFKDFIDSNLYSSPPVNGILQVRYQNLESVRTKGVEFEIKRNISETLSSFAGFALNEADNLTNDAITPDQLKYGLSHISKSGNVSTNYVMTYMADSPRLPPIVGRSGSTPAVFAPRSITHDVFIDLDLSENFDLRLGIRNITDEKYWDWVSVAGLAQGTAQQYLNPGTNLSLDLRYTF